MFPAKDFNKFAKFANRQIANAYATCIRIRGATVIVRQFQLVGEDAGYCITLQYYNGDQSVVTCGLMQALYENGLLDRVIEYLGADLQELPAEFHPMYWNRYA